MILSIDQGTTGTTVLVFDRRGYVRGAGYAEHRQIYPRPGWVEHDPVEIRDTAVRVTVEAMADARIGPSEIAGIGITNQRETTVVWDRTTMEPVYNAIVWQCRRTAEQCAALRAQGLNDRFQQKTGLVIDPYFSATKIAWLLEHIPGLRAKTEKDEIAFGTIDTWLLGNLTGGHVHVTDYTNASRTMLFNIQERRWDDELLDLLSIPASILPEVRSSSETYSHTAPDGPFGRPIPVAGIAGDQQAALFGQKGTNPGRLKNTYGTGCFLLLNMGDRFVSSKSGLLTTLASDARGGPVYASEGSVFNAGSTINWLRDQLGIIRSPAETEGMARSIPNSGGVYFVPAFTGLGAPHWDPKARGTIVGLTRGVGAREIVRAALESIAYQTADLIDAMQSDAEVRISALNADGGASQNDFLMQFQADILNLPVIRPKIVETTALGVALLAGLAVGFWGDLEEVESLREPGRTFEPTMSEDRRQELLAGWRKAVETAKEYTVR